MNSPELILDTDILSLLMRKNAAVLARSASAYAAQKEIEEKATLKSGMKKKAEEFVCGEC